MTTTGHTTFCQSQIEGLLSTLPEKNAEVARLRLLEGCDPFTIAEDMGVTFARVADLYRGAMSYMRHPSRAAWADAYACLAGVAGGQPCARVENEYRSSYLSLSVEPDAAGAWRASLTSPFEDMPVAEGVGADPDAAVADMLSRVTFNG